MNVYSRKDFEDAERILCRLKNESAIRSDAAFWFLENALKHVRDWMTECGPMLTRNHAGEWEVTNKFGAVPDNNPAAVAGGKAAPIHLTASVEGK